MQDKTWTWEKHGKDGAFIHLPMRFTNWVNGEPNYDRNYERCLKLTKATWYTGLWNGDNCNGLSGFICEFDRGRKRHLFALLIRELFFDCYSVLLSQRFVGVKQYAAPASSFA